MKRYVDREIKTWTWIIVVVAVVVIGTVIFGWTGISRGCSGCVATARGADWIVVQLDLEGRPFRCWELHGVSIANESQSDGIYWEEEGGNLVHISGLYNRVQVENESWNGAYGSLGLTREECRRVREARNSRYCAPCYSTPEEILVTPEMPEAVRAFVEGEEQ